MKYPFEVEYNITNKKRRKCLYNRHLRRFYSFSEHKINNPKTVHSSPKIQRYRLCLLLMLTLEFFGFYLMFS